MHVMKMGIKTIIEGGVGALIAISINALTSLPWYFSFGMAVMLLLLYNFLFLPVARKFNRKDRIISQDTGAEKPNEIEPKIREIFPNGVGIGIIGGSDNHVIDSKVSGWSNGVGIGIANSPGSTVKNSEVSDESPEQ